MPRWARKKEEKALGHEEQARKHSENQKNDWEMRGGGTIKVIEQQEER